MQLLISMQWTWEFCKCSQYILFPFQEMVYQFWIFYLWFLTNVVLFFYFFYYCFSSTLVSIFTPPWSPTLEPFLPPTLEPTAFGFVHVCLVRVPLMDLPLFSAINPRPIHPGYCQFVLYFHVSGYILLACLFCWLGSTYRWVKDKCL